MTANDNEFVYAACEGCSKTLRFGDKIFRYADGIMTCETCSPTWGEAEEAFERDAENRKNLREFKRRLHDHLTNGGKLNDKCLETL